MKISRYFELLELTRSDIATRLLLDNSPTDVDIERLQVLCRNILDKIYDQFGPIILNSVYRSRIVNKKLGGSTDSQHCKGEAADIEILGITNQELIEWIVNNCEYDQVILEFYNPEITGSGWVHVSFKKNGNRKEILTSILQNKKVVYKPGIIVNGILIINN